jgi:hypothetical protein
MTYVSDRQYISQFAQDLLIFTVREGGQVVDPHDNKVHTRFINEDTETTIFQRDAERFELGDYQVRTTSAETAQPGKYKIRWEYTADHGPEVYEGYVEIGKQAPAYDALAPNMKEVVDLVVARFSDMFDAPDGGPNFATYWMTNYGRGRIAQLLRIAVGRLNTIAQPYMTYTVDGDGGAAFPVQQWGALLERATYVEVLKHFRRSYVEQPQFMGGQVTRLDRRDYLQRWGEILEDEEEDLAKQLDTFKINNMGLGKPKVLVSGGVYGRWSPTRYAGSAAARGRFFNRFW